VGKRNKAYSLQLALAKISDDLLRYVNKRLVLASRYCLRVERSAGRSYDSDSNELADDEDLHASFGY
jgi:hypothetical protein